MSEQELNHWQEQAGLWAYAFGAPSGKALFKSIPEDFVVEEILGFEMSGEGEHLYLCLEKKEHNTQQLIDRLVGIANCRRFEIGYAGLKDKHAVTRQWFSVPLLSISKSELLAQIEQMESDGIRLLSHSLNRKKLRVGSHWGNGFKIRLRDCIELVGLEDKLARVKEFGFPNYFGPQRFGYEFSNLKRAIAYPDNGFTQFEEWGISSGLTKAWRNKSKRKKLSIQVSSVRSWLFNEVLSERIKNESWNTCIENDWMCLDGTQSFFDSKAESEGTLNERLSTFDIHPSALMFGKSFEPELLNSSEQEVYRRFKTLCEEISQLGIDSSRRSLRVKPKNLQWQIIENDCHLSFELPSGSYATSLLREVVSLVDG